MFKGRLGLWAILFSVALAINICFNWLPDLFSTYDTTIMIDVESDPNISEFVIGSTIVDYNMILNNTDPTVIISSDKITDEGYVEYENYLSSPIVLFASAEILRNSNNRNGFIEYSSGNAYQIELYTLLEAMEKEATFESLGFNESVINGPVVLHIPSEASPYYQKVVDLFYLTLNYGKVPTETDFERLTPRVDALLQKCIKVADIRQSIKDESVNPSETKKFFIAPEYLHKTSAGMYQPGNGSYAEYMPVYFNKTIYLKANIYLRNTENGLVSVGKWFLEDIQKEKAFMNKTGWRVANHTYSVANVSSVYMENP